MAEPRALKTTNPDRAVKTTNPGRAVKASDRDRALPPLDDDPVLSALDQAEAAYRELRAAADAQLTSERETSRHLGEELEASRRQLQQEQDKTERQRARAQELARLLKDIHRSIFGGSIYQLLLRACLTLTGATRGLYITARGEDRVLRIRAAVEIEGYPESRPSEFITALSHAVLDDQNTLVCNQAGDLPDLPAPERASEQFHNWIAAPVVLLQDLDGILVAADKMSGDFHEEDVDALLTVGDQASVAVENSRLRREVQGAYLSTITALADAVEAKDPYTHGHCERLARFAHRIAEELDLSEHDRSLVFCAALLHDVGKIAVSDGVLNKPGPLLPEERDLVRSHVRIGYDMVRKVSVLETVADIVLRHHEWYDGNGYPEGLRGDEIPLAARIVAVADAYGAMIDKRSYKEAYDEERARDELTRCAGTQFDPRVVEAFLAVLDRPRADDEDDEVEIGYAALLSLGAAPAV